MDKLKKHAWQIVAGLLALLLVVQTVRIEGFLVWPIGHKGLKAELNDMTADRDRLQGELDKLSTEMDEQRRISSRNLDQARQERQRAKVITRIIREAPNPANCGTPAEEEARNIL